VRGHGAGGVDEFSDVDDAKHVVEPTGRP